MKLTWSSDGMLTDLRGGKKLTLTPQHRSIVLRMQLPVRLFPHGARLMSTANFSAVPDAFCELLILV